MDIFINIICFVLGIVYMVAAVSIGLRVDERCKKCLCDATKNNEFYFYLVLIFWPITIPVIVKRSGGSVSESDVMQRDWHPH